MSSIFNLQIHQDVSPSVSLGLYSDYRTQGGGKLSLIAGEGMTREQDERTYIENE
jgi:hypothetical protein